MVHAIIPSPGYCQMLMDCVDSIEENTSDTDYEILIVNTKTKEEDLEISSKICAKYGNVRVHNCGFYHFATVNNDAARNWFGKFPGEDFLLFCNNDIEFRTDCIGKMLEVCSKPGVGTVGALLYFPDGTVQHAGVGLDWKTINCYHIGYHANVSDSMKPTGTSAVSANTAALMMVRMDNFVRIGGFNADYRICFEDLEMNLRLADELGLKNVICYDAVATHRENATRGPKIDPVDYARIRVAISKHFFEIVKKKNGIGVNGGELVE